MPRPQSLRARTAWLFTVIMLIVGCAAAGTITIIVERNTRFDQLKNANGVLRTWINVSDAVSSEISAAPAGRNAAQGFTDAQVANLANTSGRTRLSTDLATWRAQRSEAALTTVRSDVRTPRARAVQNAARATTDLEDSIHRLTAAVVGILVLFALVLAVAMGRFRRWTREPLHTLGTSVRLLTHGHLTDPVSVQGPQDFQQLGAEIEELRLTLLRENERSTQAEEALAQAPPVLESLRQQLVPPVRLPDLSGLSVGFATRPAEGVVAGDWCDLIELDGGLIGLIIGDVSGHGVDPGLVALQTKLLISAALKRGLEPSRAVHWAQDQINITDDVIVTAWAGVINRDTLSLRYTCAGHPPGWHRSPSGQVHDLLSNGTLISTLGGSWATQEMRLERGSIVVLLTDGILEARNSQGVEFGEKAVLRIVELTLQRPEATAKDIADNVLLTARQHCTGRLHDDATVLVVRAD